MEEVQKLEDEEPTSCNFLKDPLSISELIGGGTTFEINSNFDEGFTNDIFDELNIGSDDDMDDEQTAAQRAALASPWTESFAELKKQMVCVNENIYKKITKIGCVENGIVPEKARVCIRYNAYWEGDGAPFDSSFLRGTSFQFYTGRSEVIEGLEAAVLTMKRGEQAQFIISYNLLFRELGCPPRIKPRADGLFIVELVSFNAVGDVDADAQVPEEDRGKYSIIIDKIREIHLKGLDFFGQGLYKNAARAFEKAVDLLNRCHLANEDEQFEQSKFLVKLYTNLTVCYNKINMPGKTCIMCKEIRNLTNNTPSCKALFQEGRAMLMLGEYVAARTLLGRAQRMEPQNEEISKEMKLLEERFSQYKESERAIWSKAMGVAKIAVEAKDECTPFEDEMLELMESFQKNLSLKDIKLPAGLTSEEIDIVNRLSEQMKIKLVLSPFDHCYTLKKN